MVNFLNGFHDFLTHRSGRIDVNLTDPDNLNLELILVNDLFYSNRRHELTGTNIKYANMADFGLNVAQLAAIIHTPGRKLANKANSQHTILLIEDVHLDYKIRHTLHFLSDSLVAGILSIQPIYVNQRLLPLAINRLLIKMLEPYQIMHATNNIITDTEGNKIIASNHFGIRLAYFSGLLDPAAVARKQVHIPANQTSAHFQEKSPKMILSH